MSWYGCDFGTATRALARAVEADRPALIHGARVVSWGELDARTERIAAGLLAAGLSPGDAVGHQLRNGPDYMLLFLACAKAGLVPVNVNYRYRGAELADIVRRFRIRAIVTEAEFRPVVDDAAALGGAIAQLFVVDEDGLPEREGAVPTSEEHLLYVATGGTTGMPKAVVWRQEDAWAAFQLAVWPGATPGDRPRVAGSLDEHVALAAATPPPSDVARSPLLMLSPLMHGAGLFSALICLMRGGTLVTLPGRSFDPAAAIAAIARHEIVAASFVGDAFALPLADAIEADPDGPAKIARLRFIGSSGAVFSERAKARLCAANPNLTILDALGSSEAAGTAVSVTTAKGGSGPGFMAMPGRTVKVFDAELRELPPGSDGYGILARSGPLPLGYLGEDALNARTFPVIDGVRYLMTGDRARITADGRIEFAGRDNLVINTGGEKVFAEEVEAVLQAHPSVADARVIGLPDPRFGKRVAAVVQAAGTVDEAALDAHCRAHLAGYKVPRAWFFTDRSLRLNNGKPDYATAQAVAGGG